MWGWHSIDFKKLKPNISDFIRFYYEDLGNSTGGSLHIVLDDGNTEHDNIRYCLKYSEGKNDSFGYFLCLLLLEFTEEELEKMYDNNWNR